MARLGQAATALEPDDILDSLSRGAEEAEVSVLRAVDAVRRAYAEGAMPRNDALPIFLLGMVGGALGAKLLKGKVGLAIGAGVAFWAWGQLTPKKLQPMPPSFTTPPLKRPPIQSIPG